MQRFHSTVLSRALLRPNLVHFTLDVSPLDACPDPGQFFMARCEGTYLRRPLFPSHIAEHLIAVLLPLGQDLGLTWLGARQVGETIDLMGPLGRGFALDGPPGHLLLVSWGAGAAILLPLAEQAVGRGWEVTMLASFVRPDLAVAMGLLPSAVEYEVSVEGTALEGSRSSLRQALLWADRICAAGDGQCLELYSQLAAEIEEARLSLRSGIAQVSVVPPMVCGMGVCLACTVETRRGPRQACSAGPTFDLAELVL